MDQIIQCQLQWLLDEQHNADFSNQHVTKDYRYFKKNTDFVVINIILHA